MIVEVAGRFDSGTSAFIRGTSAVSVNKKHIQQFYAIFTHKRERNMIVEVAGRFDSGTSAFFRGISAVSVNKKHIRITRDSSFLALSSLGNCKDLLSNAVVSHHTIELSKTNAITVNAKNMTEIMPLKLERKHILREVQLSKAKAAMDAFITSVQVNLEKREGASPYYLLHKAGDAVYGNVLLFHGFSMTPAQCLRLAEYLFDSGFNVYQCSLAGHYFENPNQNWPQVHLQQQWKYKLRQEILSDSPLVEAIRHFDETQEKFDFIHQKLLRLLANEADILAAIADEDQRSKSFHRFYDSSHMQYLYEAEARLEETESLPGPTFAVGLSVGGAVALGLAATHPEKIAKVVAYAPFLKGSNELGRVVTLISGPLDVKELQWQPEFKFSTSCVVAAELHGHHVRGKHNIKVLSNMPTFIMLTEMDDSADVLTDQQFIENIRSSSGILGPHHLNGIYSSSEKVPHAMIDPTEESQGMTNKYWASLYQETFRFLTESIVNEKQLHSLVQDPNLPQVASLNK